MLKCCRVSDFICFFWGGSSGYLAARVGGLRALPVGSPRSSAGFKFQPLLEFQPAETPPGTIQNGALRCLPTERLRVQSQGICCPAVYGSVHRDAFSPAIKIPETESQQLLFLWSEGCQRKDRVSGKVQRQSKSWDFYFSCSSALILLLTVEEGSLQSYVGMLSSKQCR